MDAHQRQEENQEAATSLMIDQSENIKCSNDDKRSSIQQFRNKLANDHVFRKKILIFVSICYSFITMVSINRERLKRK